MAKPARHVGNQIHIPLTLVDTSSEAEPFYGQRVHEYQYICSAVQLYFCPWAAVPTIATYEIFLQRLGTHTLLTSPSLFGGLPLLLLLLLAHDGRMNIHINLPIRLLLHQFFPLFQDKLSHLFSLLKAKKELNKRRRVAALHIFLSFYGAPPVWTLHLGTNKQSICAVIISNEFIFIFLVGKQAALTPSRKSASLTGGFAERWRGWQSCWQQSHCTTCTSCLDSTSTTCRAAEKKEKRKKLIHNHLSTSDIIASTRCYYCWGNEKGHHCHFQAVWAI